MSGHSKWSTIKHKKGKTDAQRAKIFTKIGREIAVCVKEGGADPSGNSKLKDLIAKAKQNNVPNDNIERAIKKAASGNEKTDYENVTYEGYGPSGVALIVECLTDNRNRTAGDVRHAFDKYGGNLGAIGCVSFMFERKGIIVIENENLSEEKIMEDCMEVGAEDFDYSEEAIEITTDPTDFQAVRDGLLNLGYTLASSEIEQIPSTYTRLSEDDMVKMRRMIEMLEDNDDVQAIWHSLENEL